MQSKAMTHQEFLSFEEEEPPDVAPPSSIRWNWWDPWPIGLTPKQECLLQVKRDMRALQECDQDERGFFIERLAAFRQLIKQLAEAEQRS
jgi:hypothetical protein